MLLLNDHIITVTYFLNTEARIEEITNYLLPSGSPWFNKLSLKYDTEIDDYKINNDLMILYFIKQELDRLNAATVLELWSMPYQRMDYKNEGDLYTLPYVAKFLSDLNFKQIIVIEPHSQMTMEHLYVHPYYPVTYWLKQIRKENMIPIEGKVHIVFPDYGAFERYQNDLEKEEDICVFSKKRDHKSNSIVEHDLSQGKITKGSTCFILDDICSSGNTLYNVALYAKKEGATKVYVIVAHCEYTAIKGNLLTKDSPVDQMFTSKSMISCEHSKIIYLDIY